MDVSLISTVESLKAARLGLGLATVLVATTALGAAAPASRYILVAQFPNIVHRYQPTLTVAHLYKMTWSQS